MAVHLAQWGRQGQGYDAQLLRHMRLCRVKLLNQPSLLPDALHKNRIVSKSLNHEPQKMEIQLQRAKSSDKVDLIRIFVQAFLLDRVTILKAARHKDQIAYIGSLIEAPLDSWLNRPDRYLVIKAVASESQNAIGWVCFGVYGMEEGDAQVLLDRIELGSINVNPVLANSVTASSQRPMTEGRNDLTTVRTGNGIYTDAQVDAQKLSSIDDLEALCSADMQSWMKKLMPEGGTGMFIASICVDPNFQGTRLGRALLQTATQLADPAQLTVWVHSSEAGARLFATNGFVEVGRLKLDLRDYSLNEDMRLPDPYVYRCMLRQPG
jgi:ribosomal protein S18 acetylase RimI-like enzyme